MVGTEDESVQVVCGGGVVTMEEMAQQLPPTLPPDQALTPAQGTPGHDRGEEGAPPEPPPPIQAHSDAGRLCLRPLLPNQAGPVLNGQS